VQTTNLDPSQNLHRFRISALSSICSGLGIAAAAFCKPLASVKNPAIPLPLSHPLWHDCLFIMKRSAREFLQSTTTLLDHVLTSLIPEEQHGLLDALAGKVEERLDALAEALES
jgi:hypothetical protein